MTGLPQGWAETRFADLTVNYDGRRIPLKASDRAARPGTYRYYGAQGVIDHINDFLFDGTYLLVAEDGANLSSRTEPIAQIASGQFWVNNHHVVQAVDGVSLDYLKHYLNGQSLEGVVRGTAQPKLTQAGLNDLLIRLAPTREQDQIVAAIDEQLSRLETGVRLLRSARRKLVRLRAAVLHAAVSGWLVEQNDEDESAGHWLVRHGKHVSGSQRDGALPKGWTRTTIGSLKTWSLYGPRFTSAAYVSKGVPVLRTSDITAGGNIRIDKAPKLALSATDTEKYRVHAGDILITRTGSIGTVAYIADDRPAIPGAYLILYRLGLPIAFSEYLFYVLQSPSVQTELMSKSAGVGRPNLNAPSIDSITVDVPPFAEMQTILAELKRWLSIIEAVDTVLAGQEARGASLRSSILSAAFSGKLSAQAREDEPASELVKRIAARRAEVAECAGRGKRARTKGSAA